MVLHATQSADIDANAATVGEVIGSVNSALRQAGGPYGSYSCKTVSWDDVQRGTVDGSLSCWGANITDTRLYAKSGQLLYTVRSDNWNEKLGSISSRDLALIVGNEQPGGGSLTPVTLADVLKNAGKHCGYAGTGDELDLSATTTDDKVSIRFMTTFLPVQDEALSTLEFAPEVYQYQTRTAQDPANLLLLATTQGLAVQANGAGATKLYHHAVEPSGTIARYWFEAERSAKKVGGPQAETREEAVAAAARGKATAAVIGTRSMGTRFNVLMTVQVPLQQQPKPKPRSNLSVGSLNDLSVGSAMTFMMSDGDEGDDMLMDDDLLAEMDELEMGCAAGGGEWGMPLCMPPAAPPSSIMKSGGFGCSPPAAAMPTLPTYRSRMPGIRDMIRLPRVGRANAARVSRGSMVDRVDKTVEITQPKRDPAQHVTVTVVIYNTVAGGVPSAEDVKAAIDDMESLYASCGWTGRLADEGAGFMKSELTVKDAVGIAGKLVNQPYKPPAGAIGLVQGGDIFPTAAA